MSTMTKEQEIKCHKIIHTAAAGAGARNLLPAPGTGIAADIVAMTTMAMHLASVFGGNIAKEVAKGMAVIALKKYDYETADKSSYQRTIQAIAYCWPDSRTSNQRSHD